MLWALVVILLAIWVGAVFVFNVAVWIVHLLLAVALITALYAMVRATRTPGP